MRKKTSAKSTFRLRALPIQAGADWVPGSPETGAERHYLLLDSDGRLPSGWVFLTYNPEVVDGKIRPVLYAETKGTSTPERGIRLIPHGAGRFRMLLPLPDRTVRLRMVVDGDSSPVMFSEVEFEEISSLKASFYLSWAVIPRVLPAVAVQARNPGTLFRTINRNLSTVHEAGWNMALWRLYISIQETPRTFRASYDDWIRKYEALSHDDRLMIRKAVEQWEHHPLISVVMPVYNPPDRYLRRAIDSVLDQVYPHWELCVADDASSEHHVRHTLEEYAKRDPRIKVVFRSERGHISAASNSALETARGDFVALLDHDDLLSERALYLAAMEINSFPDVAVIYSDEDKIDQHDRRYGPYFKSDWNPDLILSQNCISHLGVYRRSLVERAGGFRQGYEGSQDYDLALRVIETYRPEQIRHIPSVLYHWRAVPGSAALSPDQKHYTVPAARRALTDHLKRMGVQAQVLPSKSGMYHRVKRRLPDTLPRVSLIVPVGQKIDLLEQCLPGLLRRTDYRNLEVIVIDNHNRALESHGYFRRASRDFRVRILSFDRPLSYPAIDNHAVGAASGEVLGFIDPDVEVIHADWLKEMVSQISRPEVGAVGAKLCYPDDTVQHAGVILGFGGLTGNAHQGFPRDEPGYFARAELIQNYSAVTGACLLTRRAVFSQVGGLSEDLATSLYDVDYCLRLQQAGYRIVWTPYAELYRHKSVSRGEECRNTIWEQCLRETMIFWERWPDYMAADPFYNPNLSLFFPMYSMAFPPRIRHKDGRKYL